SQSLPRWEISIGRQSRAMPDGGRVPFIRIVKRPDLPALALREHVSHNPASRRRMQAVRLLEQRQQTGNVLGFFDKTLRVPWAVGHRKEVTAVDMDRPGQPTDWIDDGVYDVRSKGHDLALAERLGSGGFDPTLGITRRPSPEDVVLAARVDSDDSPEPMVVG